MFLSPGNVTNRDCYELNSSQGSSEDILLQVHRLLAPLLPQHVGLLDGVPHLPGERGGQGQGPGCQDLWQGEEGENAA